MSQKCEATTKSSRVFSRGLVPRRWLGGLGILIVANASFAASVSPIVGYIGTYSTNILRTSEDEEWEYVNRPLVGMDVDHRGRYFNAYGYATAEYFDYTQQTAENETYFDINGIAQWNIVGDRIVWVLEDYASVTPVVISDPVTPLNVEQRNILATGPTFSLRLGDRNQLDWSLRYADFYYQLSNIGNNRWYSDLGITRQFNPNNSLRLGYQYTETIFNDEIYNDYKRQDIYATHDHFAASTNITTSIGYTFIDEENTEIKNDGWLLRIVGSGRIGARTTMNVVASSALTDTGLANLSSGVHEVIPDVAVTPSLAFSTPSQDPTAEIFRQTVLSLGVVNEQPELITRGAIGYVDADYKQDETQDNSRIAFDLNADHLLSINSMIGAYFEIGRTEYPNFDVDENVVDNDGTIGVNFTRIVARRVNLVFDVSRYVRNSNQPSRGYTDTVLEIQLIYRPSGRRSAVRRVRGR